jgi:HPt (histidine-containing phosphotransfer) domain-containing protein
MTDPIDEAAFAQTIEMVGGDRTFLAELVETYRIDGAERIAEMRSSLAAGSASELQRAAHTVKGSSATLGAVHLADLCREVELRARDGDLEGLAPSIEAIAIEFESVADALVDRTRTDR